MKHFAHIVAFVAIVVLAACNLPVAGSTPGPSVNEQAGTIVAATLNAAASATSPAITPFASPVSSPAATPTVKPTFLVSTDSSQCRGGPGADFPVIATFPAGTSVDLAGKDTADSYYIVIDPTSHNLCWIQAQNGTPAGSFSNLLEVTPPASAANPKAPTGPGYVVWSFECSGSQVTVNLSWPDNADNESGYHIYRNGTQISDLPPNSTSYTDTTNDTAGGVIVYGVAAYNDTGSSPQAQTASAASGKNTPISCQ